MKILIASDWYAPAVNGVVTSIVNLRKQLLADGHEVKVLTLSTDHSTHCSGDVYAIGSVGAGMIYPGARVRSVAVGRIVRDLIDWCPDVVHTQCEFSTFFLAKRIARASDAPLVHTYHTVYEDYTHYFSPSRTVGKAAVKSFSRFMLHQTDAVIAPTAKVQALLEGYGVDTPVYVVPTGIDLSRFAHAPSAAETAARRRSLGVPDGNKIILFLGRLAKEKNVDELIACMATMKAEPGSPAASLVLVGDGPERETLTALAAASGLVVGQDVIFAGMVPPQFVSNYYHMADVFASASTSETQGLTSIEALSAGLPTVFRADECLNGVIENGVNGWQYQTMAEMQGYLHRLLTDEPLRQTMAQNAANSAQAFSMQRFGQAALAVYQRYATEALRWGVMC